ncbi:MAG: hypothetical protein AAB462_02635 [Patescibacteria group bacterium]
MSSFENGLCPVEEYKAGESDRIMESELAVAGLYTLMELYKSGDTVGAAKFASRVDDVEQLESGLYSVKFMIFNPYTAHHHTEAIFDQGFWRQDLSHSMVVWPSQSPETRHPVTNAYLREPRAGSDSVDKALQAMLENSNPQPVDAVSREAVLV